MGGRRRTGRASSTSSRSGILIGSGSFCSVPNTLSEAWAKEAASDGEEAGIFGAGEEKAWGIVSGGGCATEEVRGGLVALGKGSLAILASNEVALEVTRGLVTFGSVIKVGAGALFCSVTLADVMVRVGW